MAREAPEPEDLPDTKLKRLLYRFGHLGTDVRDWAIAHKVRSALLGLSVALGMTVTLMAWTFFAETVVGPEEVVTLEMALEALDAGEHDEARSLIKRLQRERLAPEDFGGPAFVLGAIKAKEAAVRKQSQQRSAHLIASHYLRLAHNRGFPRDRVADGHYLLSRSLVACGRYQEAVPRLEDALPLNPHRASELHKMFVRSLIHLPNPEYERALEHSSQYLSDIGLSFDERLAAQIDRGRIYLALGRPDDCHAVIETIESSLQQTPQPARMPGEVALLKGQLLMSEADSLGSDPAAESRRIELLTDAIKIFRESQAYDRFGAEINRQSMYLIGRCYQKMGPEYVARALEQLTRTRNLYLDTAEGVAAALAEGELLLEHNRVEDAVAAFRRALLSAPDPEVYVNAWLSLDALRVRVLQVHDSLVDQQRFEESLELVDVFAPIFDLLQTTATRANTLRRWGAAALERAESLEGAEASAAIREGRAHFRQAGAVYERLADMHFDTRQYTDDLWQAADSYAQGHSFTSQARLLEKYLADEIITRRPLGLAKLGEAKLSLGEFDEATAALQECIEFHADDPAVYQARITGSIAYQERKEFDRAAQLLIDNLTNGQLEPSSPEWRDSLFQLGFLLHEQGKHIEAIHKLEEAVERYPDAEAALLGRYTIADASRHAARDPLRRIQEAATENERQKNRRLAQDYLIAALEHYEAVQKKLATAEMELPPLNAALLRNCYLMRGSMLMDLRQYERALDVFRNASSLYQNDPAVLEAYVQISHCHRRLGQFVEARGALEQAKVVLEKLPADADFQLATNFSRTEWSEILEQMSQW